MILSEDRRGKQKNEENNKKTGLDQLSCVKFNMQFFQVSAFNHPGCFRERVFASMLYRSIPFSTHLHGHFCDIPPILSEVSQWEPPGDWNGIALLAQLWCLYS